MTKDKITLWYARAVCAARHVMTPSVALEEPEDYWSVVGLYRCREEIGNGRLCNQRFVAFSVIRDGVEHAAVNTEALALALFSGDHTRVDGALIEFYMAEARFPAREPTQEA